LVKSKQPHKSINILQKVREKGHDIKLYITGGGGGSAESSYETLVKKMVQENADWVTLYQNLSYSDYAKILYKCKYGIHLKREPFGISVAEMVRAGAIPFVKSQGGQTEIVGRQNTELFFENEEQASETILAVLESSELQEKLISSLQDQQNLFSTGHFCQEIVDLVAQYFAK
jgi:glycosyltransferase involved in cell wall biosynthesis